MADMYDIPEISAEQAGILRRQKIAELMQQQSLQPIDNQGSARKFVIPTSPLEGLAKVAQAYFGSNSSAQANQDQMALARKSMDLSANERQKVVDAMNNKPNPNAGQIQINTPDGSGTYQSGDLNNLPAGMTQSTAPQTIPKTPDEQIAALQAVQPSLRFPANQQWAEQQQQFVERQKAQQQNIDAQKQQQSSTNQHAADQLNEEIRYHNLMTNPLGSSANPNGTDAIDLTKVSPVDMAAAERYRKTLQLPTNMGRGVQGMIESRRLRSVAAALDTRDGITPDQSIANAKNYNQSFGVEAGAEKSFLNKNGPQIRGFNVLLNHLDTAQSLYDALGNGDIQAINQAKNAYEKATGQAAPTNLATAKQIIGAEVVRAVTGASGALGDRQTAEQNLSSNASDAQFMGGLDTVKQLALGQLQGQEQQYKSITGNRGDFQDRFLTDKSKNLYQNKFAPATNTPSADGTQKRLVFDAQGNLVQ